MKKKIEGKRGRSLRLAFPEFSGKDDYISKDGLGDGVIRRWGDGEPENAEFGVRNTEYGI
jgi:hypothetical protein